eukprot:1189874-Prorocentrum_minimum.AAC.7
MSSDETITSTCDDAVLYKGRLLVPCGGAVEGRSGGLADDVRLGQPRHARAVGVHRLLVALQHYAVHRRLPKGSREN